MKSKKGMGIGDLYPFVLVLLTVGLVIGIGSIVSDEFMQQVTQSEQANISINNSINAMGDVSDWFSVITVVVVAVIILGLVISALVPKEGVRGI